MDIPRAYDITTTVPWTRIGDMSAVNADAAVQQWTAAAHAAGLDVEVTPYVLAHPTRDLAIVAGDGLLVTLYIDGDQVRARLLDEMTSARHTRSCERADQDQTARGLCLS